MIQQKLESPETTSPNFVSALVNALQFTFSDAMANQFGNYLCQKIIEVAAARDLSLIVHAILPKATSISMSVHGTRAMQTLVEVLADKVELLNTECLMLVRELENSILNLSTHVNGNHVIQAFLTSFKSSEQP